MKLIESEAYEYPLFHSNNECEEIKKELDDFFSIEKCTFLPRKSDPTFGSFVSLEWSLRKDDYTVPTGNKTDVPPKLKILVDRLVSLVPEQRFDFAFVHKYFMLFYFFFLSIEKSV
jgi:hypothetical protein